MNLKLTLLSQNEHLLELYVSDAKGICSIRIPFVVSETQSERNHQISRLTTALQMASVDKIKQIFDCEVPFLAPGHSAEGIDRAVSFLRRT